MKAQKILSALGKFALTVAFLAALCSPMKAQVIQKTLLPGVNRLQSAQPVAVGPAILWNLTLPAGGTSVVIDVESLTLATSFNYTVGFGAQSIDNPNIVPFSAAGPAYACVRTPYNKSNGSPPAYNFTFSNFLAGIFAQQFMCPMPTTGHLALSFQITAGTVGSYAIYTNVLMGPIPEFQITCKDTTGGVCIGGSQYVNINTNTTVLFVTGGPVGVILNIQVNNPGSGWSFSICDTSGGSCTLGAGSVANSSALSGFPTFTYNAQLNNGLVITTGGTTPGDLTVSWRK